MAVALLFSLRFKPVQTYIAKKAANYLSKQLHTKIEIAGLYVKPFKSVVLEGFYLEDLQKDTLIYSPRLTIDADYFSLKERKISVNTIQMDNGKFYLKDLKDGTTNLTFIINYFNTGKATAKKKPTKPFDITFNKIVLNNISFKYHDYQFTDTIKGVNFSDLYLRNLNTVITGLDTKTHLAAFAVKNLTFREKSGFFLKNFSAKASIDSNKMEFRNLLLETPTTRLADYVLFKYKQFKDFNEFVSKVYVKANFANTHLHPQDIAYFAPQIGNVNLDFDVNGTISGYVNNIKAKNLSLKAGQATYLKGNFTVTGLPNIKETFLDLQFERINSNKKDADRIIKALTGNKTSIIPPIVQKFGNISFAGRFTGFPKDFIAYGEFKTSLGRIVTDVNLKINKTPIYSGTIKTYDFNLGELLDNKLLGRTTMVATIKGSGFDVKHLNQHIDSKLTYFDFKGYRYHKIAVNGTFNHNNFDGKLKISDANLHLDFNGGVNLNPKLPVFNFIAHIRGANLNRLHLLKDTIQLDADFNTNFSGNTIDNIQGKFALGHIRLTNPRTSLVVDSVYLSAEGFGSNRSLVINSDILDASIKGEYDLANLPGYFKSVVKRYIPSFPAVYARTGKQNFEFKLNLKNFEPLGLLFMPDLKIPEGAVINGKFVSATNSTTLNGFSKLIQYKNIKINNLILDETNMSNSLNLFLTSDRIDFSDSLYVKNINIANILKNDSLSLNVKLSDKNAINQLDLNGLVEFGRDTTAKFSVLPSDIIINREVWKIQEKVSISFDKNRVLVKGFELSRDNQVLSINGIVSEKAEDHLMFNFKKFKLTTFSPLTKGLGVDLSGELNGDVAVAALSKTPHFEAGLKVDSLAFNKLLIGDLKFDADFDNATKLVNAKIKLTKEGLQTLDIEGTYNAKAEENTLNMAVKMDNSELIIFEPLVKDLVSDLKGHVSANLTLTGKLTDPKINGDLSMNNAGMTVNYLKTPYHITDKVTVTNSVIKLDNITIKDIQNNEAIANGTVDMRNPTTPLIDLKILAKNFMALNTTAKDNSLYYGTAYGSGVFSFYGPTDNMRIDIDAKTEEGTVFNIPLNSASKVSENEFITFVAKDSLLTARIPKSFNGLTMNFTLAVDENTIVNIYTDLGKLYGRGNASLSLNITSFGDFKMSGDYLISEGKFEFTAQDVVNKIFDITNGGSIRWTGNPTQAAINLKALYAYRTSLAPLYSAAGRPAPSGNTRVQSEAIMNLSGSLLHPNISFGLNFPNDANVRDELQNYFSDVNNVNQQALSLIVRRSFFDSNNGGGTLIQSTVTNAATELLFNQFNNILSQNLNLKNVDINVHSFNEANLSIKLLNERLLLAGGVIGKNEKNDLSVLGSEISRDLEASYLIRKDGSLAIKASNRLNNRSFLNNINQDYITAIGLAYRQDFDNFNEFIKILIGQKRREDRRKKTPASSPVINPPIATIPEETTVPANSKSPH